MLSSLTMRRRKWAKRLAEWMTIAISGAGAVVDVAAAGGGTIVITARNPQASGHLSSRTGRTPTVRHQIGKGLTGRVRTARARIVRPRRVSVQTARIGMNPGGAMVAVAVSSLAVSR